MEKAIDGLFIFLYCGFWLALVGAVVYFFDCWKENRIAKRRRAANRKIVRLRQAQIDEVERKKFLREIL